MEIMPTNHAYKDQQHSRPNECCAHCAKIPDDARLLWQADDVGAMRFRRK